MNRREFLQAAVTAPAVRAVRTRRRDAAGGRIVVIGAGLAGLAAAYELERAGREVVVLEARLRPGGRVHTLREPFSDGLYAEAGAARIQDSHRLTLDYVRRFSLPLDPFWPSDGSRVMRVGGTRLVIPPQAAVDLSRLPLQFSAEELRLGLAGSLRKYLFSHLPALGDPSAGDWRPRAFERFEMSIDEFCRRQGASPGMRQMVALGHDLGAMSAFQFLRDAALGMATRQWYKIRGGNDLLPRALAAELSDRIRYGAAVTRIEQDAAAVRVTCRAGRGLVTFGGEYAICTIPPPVLRGVEISPVLSAAARAAIDGLDLMPMARVHLQARRRFWHDRGDSGWATTDDPIDVWDYTRDQPGARGILGAYTSGRMARAVTALDEAARGPFVLAMMERVHPGMREHYEGAASYSWTADPWARGAAAEFKPGQLSAFHDALRRPEGRLHFAGEHTSPWTGWMNGALESGQRAASEILAKS